MHLRPTKISRSFIPCDDGKYVELNPAIEITLNRAPSDEEFKAIDRAIRRSLGDTILDADELATLSAMGS